TREFRGRYHVLGGAISPIAGRGPADLHIAELVRRLADDAITEVILATNFTNEGEATAHTVASLLSARGVKVSRLSRGVPVGGELEHTDIGTIGQALIERRAV
ncbi:MAG: toprim domain-containing protein, partial [Thauera sp.]